MRFVKGASDPLSNFFLCSFTFMGQRFRSVEHAYQYEKARFSGLDGLTERIRNCNSAYSAKMLGQEVPRSTSWESLNFNLMNQLLKLKWEQVPYFRNELLAAKGMEIVHPVSDIFWGTGTKDRKGRDVFGALLQNLLKIKIRSPERPHSRNHTHAPTISIPIQTTNRFDALAPNSNTNIPASQKHDKTHTPIFETPTRDLTQVSPKKLNISAESPEAKYPWKIGKPVDYLVSSLYFPL